MISISPSRIVYQVPSCCFQRLRCFAADFLKSENLFTQNNLFPHQIEHNTIIEHVSHVLEENIKNQ